MRFEREQEDGFSLIELMVSLVIISVGLLSLGSFTMAVLSTDNVARQRTVATHLAEQEMEGWFSEATPQGLFGAASTPSGCPDFQSAYLPKPGCYGWPKTINNTVFKIESFEATPSTGIWTSTLAGSLASEMRSVTVYWQNKGDQKSVTISHIKRVQ